MFTLIKDALNDLGLISASDIVDANHQPQATTSAINTLKFSFYNKDLRTKLLTLSWYLHNVK